MVAKRGRPPVAPGKTKKEYLEVRLASGEKAAFKAAATAAGLPLSAWVRERLSLAARMELQAADRKPQQREGVSASLSACQSIIVPVTTLAPEPYEIIQEIRVVVQPAGDEYLATFFDANINAQGNNETEAIDHLKDIMLGVFEHLLAQPAKRLGAGPKRQLAILQKFIRKYE